MSNTIWPVQISEGFNISQCVLQLGLVQHMETKTVLYKWLSVRYCPLRQDSIIIPIISIGGVLFDNIPIRHADMYDIGYGRHAFVPNYVAIRKELTVRNFHVSHI